MFGPDVAISSRSSFTLSLLIFLNFSNLLFQFSHFRPRLTHILAQRDHIHLSMQLNYTMKCEEELANLLNPLVC